MASTETANQDADILARLTALWRGDSELADDIADAVGEAIYAIDAPRVGNGSAPYTSLGPWDRARYQRLARVAVSKYLTVAAAALPDISPNNSPAKG